MSVSALSAKLHTVPAVRYQREQSPLCLCHPDLSFCATFHMEGSHSKPFTWLPNVCSTKRSFLNHLVRDQERGQILPTGNSPEQEKVCSDRTRYRASIKANSSNQTYRKTSNIQQLYEQGGKMYLSVVITHILNSTRVSVHIPRCIVPFPAL